MVKHRRNKVSALDVIQELRGHEISIEATLAEERERACNKIEYCGLAGKFRFCYGSNSPDSDDRGCYSDSYGEEPVIFENLMEQESKKEPVKIRQELRELFF